MGSAVVAVAVALGVSRLSGSPCTHVAVTARLALTGTISFIRGPRLPREAHSFRHRERHVIHPVRELRDHRQLVRGDERYLHPSLDELVARGELAAGRTG